MGAHFTQPRDHYFADTCTRTGKMLYSISEFESCFGHEKYKQKRKNIIQMGVLKENLTSFLSTSSPRARAATFVCPRPPSSSTQWGNLQTPPKSLTLAVLSNCYLLQEFEVQSLIEFSLYTFDLDVSYNTEFGRRIPYWK